MNTLKLSVSLPDETHPDMELRLSANDSPCDVVIALPMHAKVRVTPHDTEAQQQDDEYVRGGYAGI
jgi:hypothetical protein